MSTFHNVVSGYYWTKLHVQYTFATQSEILEISAEIHFLTPTRSGILYLASPCYASLRSDSAICFALYKIPELLGVKKRISLSTKRIPLFVANGIEQSIIIQYIVVSCLLFAELILQKYYTRPKILGRGSFSWPSDNEWMGNFGFINLWDGRVIKVLE